MRYDAQLHKSNVITLEKLQHQIDALISTIGELIVINDQALTRAVLDAASDRASTDVLAAIIHPVGQLGAGFQFWAVGGRVGSSPVLA